MQKAKQVYSADAVDYSAELRWVKHFTDKQEEPGESGLS